MTAMALIKRYNQSEPMKWTDLEFQAFITEFTFAMKAVEAGICHLDDLSTRFCLL